MDATRRRLRRAQLDHQLSSFRGGSLPAVPKGGWLASIREALGMSLEVFGARLGVSRQTAHDVQKSEVDESISVRRLRAAANALECDLVVLVIPRQPLEEIVQQQALRVANAQIRKTTHSMALEAQSVAEEQSQYIAKQLAYDLVNRGDRRLWE